MTAFELCFLLYGIKTAVVSNTAAAALQQLVALIFDNVTIEDSMNHFLGSETMRFSCC